MIRGASSTQVAYGKFLGILVDKLSKNNLIATPAFVGSL